MEQKNYQLAGWAAIVYAVISVPAVVLSFFLQEMAKYFPNIIVLDILLTILGFILSVFILYKLRKLLNGLYDFHLIDGLIAGLILLIIIMTISSFAKYFFPDTENFRIGFAVVLLAQLVVYSIIKIIVGIRLLRLNDDLFGLQKAFAYTNIVSGVCVASVILSPIGILIDLAVDIIMGIIFLRADENAEFV